MNALHVSSSVTVLLGPSGWISRRSGSFHLGRKSGRQAVAPLRSCCHRMESVAAAPPVDGDSEQEDDGEEMMMTEEESETMERLEEEVMLGHDEGKAPTDYHRRAYIFQKSSQLFQAIKDAAQPSANSQAT